MRLGYMLITLSHPILGRPLVKSLPYGSSIPETDPSDFANMEIVRLAPTDEDYIADHAEEAARLRSRADLLETAMAEEAEALITRFME